MPVRTYNLGDPVGFGELNDIQGVGDDNRARVETREVPTLLALNFTESPGSGLSFVGKKIVSLSQVDGFTVPINGVLNESVAKITGIRLRVNQVTADQWDMILWEGDASGVESAIATHVPDLVTGWKDINFGPLNVSIQDNYYWYVKVDHNNNGGGIQTLEATVMNVQFGT